MLKASLFNRPAVLPQQQRNVAARAAAPKGNPAQPAKLAAGANRKSESPANPKTADEAVDGVFDRIDEKKGTKANRTEDTFNLRNNASVGSRRAAAPEEALDDNQRK